MKFAGSDRITKARLTEQMALKYPLGKTVFQH